MLITLIVFVTSQLRDFSKQKPPDKTSSLQETFQFNTTAQEQQSSGLSQT